MTDRDLYESLKGDGILAVLEWHMSKGLDILTPATRVAAPYFIGWFTGRYAY